MQLLQILQFLMVPAILADSLYEEEQEIINANLAEDVTKLDQDNAGDASHGSAYKSIISNYYVHDPYFGAGVSPKMTKNEAVKKLKKILLKRRVDNNNSNKMAEDESITREMIPAPLLSRVDAADKYSFQNNQSPVQAKRGDYFQDGIPAPLLVGGSFRQNSPQEFNNQVLKKTLEIEEKPKSTRMHVQKSSQRQADARKDEFQERSVFSELISGQRQVVAPPKENIDPGFIDVDIDDTQDDKRGFFPDKDFKNGFNPDRKKYSFPGDERRDIPRLPEIEARENREPDLLHKSKSGHKPTSYYDIMDDFFDEPLFRKYQHHDSYRQPVKRQPEPYYHSQPLTYHNPMDYGHKHEEVDVFSHKPLHYEHREPKRPQNTGFYNHLEHDNFFVDVPKIRANPDLGKVHKRQIGKDDFHEPLQKLNIGQHLDDFPEPHSQPLRQHHPDIGKHLDDFPDHPAPGFSPPAQAQFRNIEESEDLFRTPEFPEHHQHANFKSHYRSLENSYDHFSPKVASDIPYLPPPPEMIELQKNSLFPVDVPKIGVNAPYRPPEVIFDEFHRRQEEQEPIRRQENSNQPIRRQENSYQPIRMQENNYQPIRRQENSYQPMRREEKVQEPVWRQNENTMKNPPPRITLSKFSDLDMMLKNEDEQASNFAPPSDFLNRAFETTSDDEDHEWDMESRYNQYSKESSFGANSEDPTLYRFEENRYTNAPNQDSYEDFKAKNNNEPKNQVHTEHATERSDESSPESFHNQIEEQFDFSAPPKSQFYLNEAVKQVDPPVYMPPRQDFEPTEEEDTEEYEDYEYEFPARPETLPEPVNARNYYHSTYATEQPEVYTKYDPMKFAKNANQGDDFGLPAFPEFQAFDESEFRSKPLAPIDRRSANYGRSLSLAGPSYPQDNDLEQPHQFTHVDSPDTYKAGHSRGNYHHHIRDSEERSGPHHLQEASADDDFADFMATSTPDDWGQRITF